MKKNIITITILLCTLLFNTACDKKNVDHQSITIEMDGDITYVLKEDASDLEKERLSSQYTYLKTTSIVDNGIYNFIISFPIKSKKNFYEFLRLRGVVGSIYIGTLDGKRAIYPNSKDINNVNKAVDDYYHYTVKIASNRFASEYFLNDIRNIDISYLYQKSDFSNDIEHKTNRLIIPKEQLINLLDSLAIPHDRLEFQTDQGLMMENTMAWHDDDWVAFAGGKGWYSSYDPGKPSPNKLYKIAAHHEDFEYMLWKMEKDYKSYGIIDGLKELEEREGEDVLIYRKETSMQNKERDYSNSGPMKFGIGYW